MSEAGPATRRALRSRRTACLLAAGLALTTASRADEVADATAVVARLQAALVETAALLPDAGLPERAQRLDQLIRETHDLETMGRLTVRRFWRQWSEGERAAFSESFAALSVATYASRFAGVGPDSFAIAGGKASGEQRVEVEASIRRGDGTAVSLDYLLERDGERWRIINVLADGASELSLMAAEYFEIGEAGGLDGLLAAFEQKRAALR